MRSPDGRYELETSSSADRSSGTPGMGHDMDDYFNVTETMTVREVATGRVVAQESWSADVDAGSGLPPWLPKFHFTEDSSAVIARWRDGSEKRIAIARD